MDCLIDSHCHLTFDGLRERAAAVIDRGRAAGVDRFVTIATNLPDAQRALTLSQQYRGVHVVAGIHPHEAGKAPADWDGKLSAIIRRDDVFGVGETGLDFHYDFSDRQSQMRVFRRQLEIACETGKPVVIHCREAQREVLAALSDYRDLSGVVFHCFTGTEEEAAEIWERGYWLSLTGVVTFKRSDELRRVARRMPADRFMLETDSPYISPEPVRNIRPNEPAHLMHIAACVARERGQDAAELARIATANTRRFFNLPVEA